MLHTKLVSTAIVTFLMISILALPAIACHKNNMPHGQNPPCDTPPPPPPPDPTLEELDNRVSALETALGLLETAVGTLETALGLLETAVGTLETDLGLLEIDLGLLEIDLGNLQTDVTILQEHASQDLEVVDALGEVVGKIISIEETGGAPTVVFVAFRVDNFTFVLRLFNDKFKGSIDRVGGVGPSSQGVAFDTDNCTGTPFIAFNSSAAHNSLLPTTQVTGPGNIVYTPQPGAASQLPTLRSIRRENGDCDPIVLDTTRVVPALVIVNMNTLYQFPFTLR